MDQLSDSEISLSDDEVCQLLEAVEEPGDHFLATFMGGSKAATQELQVCLVSAYRTFPLDRLKTFLILRNSLINLTL
jgi:hypothetical protein